MQLISNWFEPIRVTGKYRLPDYVLLWLILATGAVLRFWNLGYAGLHGDEDIMGLAARGVLDHGSPILPSGMVYARALIHTYIIAGSMYLFGDTEWAIRFPSAIVGSLCGLLAYFAGKRFLEPRPNLVFVALITFAPAMIEISQTGRMYVFLVACLLGFCALLFRWETTGRLGFLVSAGLTWLLGLLFHALAIFAAPLFLFPGLSRSSWKLLLQGGIAFVAGYAVFVYSSRVIRSFYPDASERGSAFLEEAEGDVPFELLVASDAWLLVGVIAAAGLAILIGRTLKGTRRAHLLPAILLLGFGVVACGLLHYHIGGIALLLGTIAWFRSGEKRFAWLIPVFVAVMTIAAVQLAILHSSGEFPGRRIIGAMVGTPSIWPPLRFAAFTPAGTLAYLAILVWVAIRFARGARLPIHALFFLMAVWAPLFGIGIFAHFPAMRHMLGIFPLFLLALVAGVSYLITQTEWGRRVSDFPVARTLVAVLLIVAIVNPLAVERVASNDYRTHPDHKGAAEFIRKLELTPEDILIAEDSINQTYYLGRVDFRLKGSINHAVMINQVPHGMYTGTPFLVSSAELEALFDRPRTGEIYIIGSGEGSVPDRRGEEIDEILASDRVEPVYEGRDGKTRIWRVVN